MQSEVKKPDWSALTQSKLRPVRVDLKN